MLRIRRRPTLLERYYAAFNAGELEQFWRCRMTSYDINQGGRETGKTDALSWCA